LRLLDALPDARPAGMLDRMLVDTARFREDDPDELVIASLACPICLETEDVEWEAALEGYDPSVQCLCPHCEESWRVYLAPQQVLRFGLTFARSS
jgi:hypothetical protein